MICRALWFVWSRASVRLYYFRLYKLEVFHIFVSRLAGLKNLVAPPSVEIFKN